MAIGHQAPSSIPSDEAKRLRDFQANLLSLISHELRTPLMGVLNALTLLDSEDSTDSLSRAELLSMARRNAQRLHHALSSLLDLAAIESGTFHIRIKEVSLARLVDQALVQVQSELAGEVLNLSREDVVAKDQSAPVLADPQKMTRAVELCLRIFLFKGDREESLRVRTTPQEILFSFQLQASKSEEWDDAWDQAQIAQSGALAGSSFSGVMKEAGEFLTRSEEGLGSEMLLLHEILRLHQGQLKGTRKGLKVELRLVLPELRSREGLRAVLASRVWSSSTGLGSVAVALVEVPGKASVEAFRAQVRSYLFRTTDAVYTLPDENRIAVVMDDCKKADAPKLLSRIEKKLGTALKYQVIACPEDGLDPDILLATIPAE